MLSVIICSKNKTLLGKLTKNISETIGVDYEIIVIDNTFNEHSIFSAYNAGFERSKYPYICFIHEDVCINTENWGEKIIAHLEEPTVGILGLAGSDLVTRIPGSCSGKTSCINIIQSDSSGKKPSVKSFFPENYSETKHSTILLDGVFLCLKRDVMNKLKFDEQIGGFHGYDFDIALQASIASYQNYVIYDIELEHFSRGKFQREYIKNLICIFRKWEKYLPLVGQSINDQKRSQIAQIEEERLLKLTKRLIKYGFSTNEIIAEATHYAGIIQSTKITQKLKKIRFKIFFLRLLYCPHNLLK